MITIRFTSFFLIYSATLSMVRALRVTGGVCSSTGVLDSLPILRLSERLTPVRGWRSLFLRPMMGNS